MPSPDPLRFPVVEWVGGSRLHLGELVFVGGSYEYRIHKTDQHSGDHVNRLLRIVSAIVEFEANVPDHRVAEIKNGVDGCIFEQFELDLSS